MVFVVIPDVAKTVVLQSLYLSHGLTQLSHCARLEMQ